MYNVHVPVHAHVCICEFCLLYMYMYFYMQFEQLFIELFSAQNVTVLSGARFGGDQNIEDIDGVFVSDHVYEQENVIKC